MSKNLRDLDNFTDAYIAAALFSSVDDDDVPLDRNYRMRDISAKSLHAMIRDCERFAAENAELLETLDDERAGQAFWLTRNGHGAGFWDGDYPEPEATELSHAAKRFGPVDLYVARGKIHQSPL